MPCSSIAVTLWFPFGFIWRYLQGGHHGTQHIPERMEKCLGFKDQVGAIYSVWPSRNTTTLLGLVDAAGV